MAIPKVGDPIIYEAQWIGFIETAVYNDDGSLRYATLRWGEPTLNYYAPNTPDWDITNLEER